MADETGHPFDIITNTNNDNVFGNPTVKTINWSYWKNLFLSKFDFGLQWKYVNSDDWNDGKSYLTVDKNYNESNHFWKINFTIDKPQTPYNIDARFYFSVDLDLLDFIHKEDDYCYVLNYSIPNTDEYYSVVFNWSDLIGLGLQLNKIVVGGRFIFTMTKFNITKNEVNYTIDPIFGDNTNSGSVFQVASGFESTERQMGLKFYCDTDCTVDNISVYMAELASAGTVSSKCAIYDDSGLDTISNGVTNEVEVDGVVYVWYVFNFSTNPSLTSGNYYYLVAFGDGADLSGAEFLNVKYSLSGLDAIIYDTSFDDIYPNFKSSWSPSNSDTSAKMSIYCSYTETTGLDWITDNQDLNGSIFNLSWFNDNDLLNGSLYNLSWVIDNQNLNGSLYNLSWFTDNQVLNGTLFNLSWFIDNQVLNGSLYNLSWFIDNQDLNGSLYNLSWFTDNQVLNGTLYNLSWFIDNQVLNGTVYNLSSISWVIDNQDLNGSLFNLSWFNDNDLLNGSLYNLSWFIDNQDLNGSLYNLSWFIDNQVLNGTIYNISGLDWRIDNQDLNGTIYNISLYDWRIDNQDLNGSIYNVSEYSLEDIIEWIEWFNLTVFNGSGNVEIGFDNNTISIFLTFGLFILFFVVGYTSKKRSGGAFMLISGFTLLSFEFLASSYLNALYIVPFLTPASIIIMLIGVRKWLWMPENEKTKSEGQ